MSIPTSTRVGGNGGRTAPARHLLILAALLSVALWYIPGAHFLAYPIRLFVTIIHEGMHALAAMLTGGSVHSVAIAPSGSGVTLTSGGIGIVITMAGYLGAALFGAACLLAGRRAGSGKRTLLLMAGAVLLVTGLWIRPWVSLFGFFSGLAVGLLLVAGVRLLSEPKAAFLASFLSVQLCLNALLDLRDLLWLTTNTDVPNDAVNMATMVPLPAWFWALLWMGIAGVMLVAALRVYWRDDRMEGRGSHAM